MIRTKRYSVASKVLIAFFAFTGIVLQTGLTGGRFNASVFRMFTNISNLVCGFYFTYAAAVILIDKSRNGGASPLPLFKGVCTMCITLTGIVAAAIVASEFDAHTPDGIATVILHIITPVLIMADWLLFDTKGRWRGWAPLLWLIAPYIYFAFIMISANMMDKEAQNRFPYPFLNYEQMGIPMLILVLAIMTLFYTLIGYLCYFIDKKMGMLEKEKGDA
ncbi:MAG: Pr6Pr family membrane protein [Clostridia bacterium]|nr:Pr6Pr family membrane protein [Clostridia bacterium]